MTLHFAIMFFIMSIGVGMAGTSIPAGITFCFLEGCRAEIAVSALLSVIGLTMMIGGWWFA